MTNVRKSITVAGQVQGVGFRPYVHRLAGECGVRGFVRNRGASVYIEAEGAVDSLNRFLIRLRSELPPLARIDEFWCRDVALENDAHFVIVDSTTEKATDISMTPDVATCGDCFRELFDPADRRYRYPFLNCTNCGPRFTIITDVPYDRERTTMASFAMCSACRREYEDPGNRRFHAEPTACPDCGPRLTLHDAGGRCMATSDPLREAVERMKNGRIVAIKGLGGFHLACPANDESAVRELRRRKHREEKPFAVLLRSVADVARFCDVLDAERELLEGPIRPIVLLRRRTNGVGPVAIAESVAPCNPLLGVMLPYTPLHHLLLADLDGVPLVMTSGNRANEPIAYEDVGAFDQLAGIADFFLTHNRRIHRRCDDSIVRRVAGDTLILRRARGYVPQALKIPRSASEPMLAVGGQLKTTFAISVNQRATISQHIGDLDDLSAFTAYTHSIRDFERFMAVSPRVIVHDLHPDYAATGYATSRVKATDRQGSTRPWLVGVQHHHAHLASCLADNDVDEQVIGVIFDGTGYGLDGTVWGGEFLLGDCRAFRRAAHFRPVAMPGGEQAIREPWRMAAAHLQDALGDARLLSASVGEERLRVVRTMIERGLNSPLTSSVGRLFDAVAAILGVRNEVAYEGQAAIELEWLACEAQDEWHYPVCLTPGAEQALNGSRQDRTAGVESNSATVPKVESPSLIVNTRPIITAVVQDRRAGTSSAVVARRFHSTLVEIIVEVCRRLQDAEPSFAGEDGAAVALSGGVFMNGILHSEATHRLAAAGFRVYRHRRVPPNDGGLSLGQLAVAAARYEEKPGQGARHVPGNSR